MCITPPPFFFKFSDLKQPYKTKWLDEAFVDFPSVWAAFPLWDGILNKLEDASDDEDRRYELRIRNPILDTDELGCPI